MVPPKSLAATFDFVDTPLSEVARSISLAYDTPILVEQAVERNVTFHLDNVNVLDGLTALCESQNLQVVQEGKVFHIRPRENRGENHFDFKDSLVFVSVSNQDIHEFIREFAANTGLNILASTEVSGRISGDLKNVSPETALRELMESRGFRVWMENGCFRVDVKRSKMPVGGKSETGNLEIIRDGELYSVLLDDAPLRSVLLEISERAGLNLALYGDIQELVRLQFVKVSLDKLLESLFRGSRYAYVKDSTGIYVSERGAKNALSGLKLYPLRHIHSEKALEQLAKFPPSGNFIASEVKEQNALLLGGSLSEIAAAESLLVLIDRPSLQVTLSCILVEIKKGNSFEIGLHSGSSRKTGEYDLGIRGFYDFLGKDVSKTGAFGKIGILPDRFEMELASLEEKNEAEVLARPKLTTLNGNKAELNVTNTVYYLVSQVSADGYPITDYRSFNDGISLELTPSVTQSGSITLEVSPEIKTAGRSTGDGPRDISTRNLKTTVTLKNGETLCLGGLRRKSTSEVRSAVPFLGSIPVIGKLFSYTSEEEEESELAIFITPEVSSNDSELVP